MATIVLDCPHCMSDRMTFDIVGHRNSISTGMGRLGVAAFCRSCARCAEARAFWRPGEEGYMEAVGNLSGSGDITGFCKRIELSPSRQKPTAPAHIPPEVERPFLQAEDNRLRRHFDAAGAMFRKALDVATQIRVPELAGRSLAERLRVMKDRNLITPEVAEWGHSVRQLGNDSVHDAPAPTAEDIADLANITRVVLTYLFEMPEQVRLMRERREGAGAQG